MQRLLVPALLLAALALPDAALAKSKHHGCPPGLAKKDNGCLPPGQAKKRHGGSDDDDDDDDDDEGHARGGDWRWERGDWIGDQEYHRIRYPDRYGLPPLGPGQRYMILGNRIVVVDEGTYRIVTILNAVDAILD